MTTPENPTSTPPIEAPTPAASQAERRRQDVPVVAFQIGRRATDAVHDVEPQPADEVVPIPSWARPPVPSIAFNEIKPHTALHTAAKVSYALFKSAGLPTLDPKTIDDLGRFDRDLDTAQTNLSE